MLSKFSLKTVNLALVLVMLAALLAACGGAAPAAPAAMPTATRAAEIVAPQLATPEAEEEAAAGEIVEGGQVNIAMWSPPNGFNPLNADSSYGQFVIDILFHSLTRFNDNVEFAPRLADSWDINEDNTEFTFHLNPDAKWHDGTPITAADVEFTMWAISHPEIVTNRANISFLKGLEGSKRPEGVETVEGIEVIDDHTIKFITKNPIDPLALLEQPGNQVRSSPSAYSTGNVAGGVRHPGFSRRNPTVGSGAFKFVRYETGQFIEPGAQRRLLRRQATPGQDTGSIVTPATMVACSKRAR